MVWHGDAEVPDDTDLIVLPGGFSYGDYLRCGAMAAQSRIMRDVKAKADKGVAVLGICNGFQILTEAGLAAGRAAAQRRTEIRLPPGRNDGRGIAIRLHARLQEGRARALSGGARRRQLFRR